MISMHLVRLSLFAAILIDCGCSNSSHVVIGQSRPPLDPSVVQVYYHAPARYDEIAILDARSSGMTTQGETDRLIARLKEEAAELGANGVLLSGIADQHGGSVLVGSATATSFGNTTTAFGSGVAVPVTYKAGTGLAIYVYDSHVNGGAQSHPQDTILAPSKTSSGPWSKLELGMARRSVREILGEPNESRGSDGELEWSYSDGGTVRFENFFVVTWVSPGTQATAKAPPRADPLQVNGPPTPSALALPDWLDGSSIVAADATFLGRVTKNAAVEDSIANSNSLYGGSSAGASIFNSQSPYGSPTGAYSPWNESTRTAPRVVSRDGSRWMFVSVNPTLTPRLDPFAVVAFVKSR
jgi:hypothetical protein